MKSIIQSEKVCYITGEEYNLQEHHVFNGIVNRKLSEKYGLKIWLRADWHNMEKYSVHMDARLDRKIKAEVQQIAMDHYGWSVEDFIRIFGKNYIN